jgi:hypothetical protein
MGYLLCENNYLRLSRAVGAGCNVKIKTGETPTSTSTIYTQQLSEIQRMRQKRKSALEEYVQ